MNGHQLDPLDRLIGNSVERITRAHHRRRLSRLGWSAALAPPEGGLWCAGDPPPRKGNAVEVLVDGARALPRMAGDLATARSHVHVAGWHVQAGFCLERESGPETVGGLLAELAERLPVRVLVWAGAPVPVFNPTRRAVGRARKQLCRGTRIVCELDSRERLMHCHHEKLVVIDDRIAFVGGIDLTALGGDRFDESSHAYRGAIGWHDALARVRGPAVADVAEHFRSRWQEVAGESLPPPGVPEPAGDIELQVVRTLTERTYGFRPRGEFRILEAYIRALGAAQRLVYVENQFLWSPEIVAVLAEKLSDPPSPDFRVLMVLPAKANNGADDTLGQLGVLAQADGDAGRFLACSLYARDAAGRQTTPVYVHAKIAIVDDAWMTIGSANLNAHSLFNDSEVNIVTQNRGLASELRVRLWAEHLETTREEVEGDPARIIDERWKPIAARQRARREAGRPLEHRLVELPSVSRRSMRLLGPLQGLLLDS